VPGAAFAFVVGFSAIKKAYLWGLKPLSGWLPWARVTPCPSSRKPGEASIDSRLALSGSNTRESGTLDRNFGNGFSAEYLNGNLANWIYYVDLALTAPF
jgi:hypothetical protein